MSLVVSLLCNAACFLSYNSTHKTLRRQKIEKYFDMSIEFKVIAPLRLSHWQWEAIYDKLDLWKRLHISLVEAVT